MPGVFVFTVRRSNFERSLGFVDAVVAGKFRQRADHCPSVAARLLSVKGGVFDTDSVDRRSGSQADAEIVAAAGNGQGSRAVAGIANAGVVPAGRRDAHLKIRPAAQSLQGVRLAARIGEGGDELVVGLCLQSMHDQSDHAVDELRPLVDLRAAPAEYPGRVFTPQYPDILNETGHTGGVVAPEYPEGLHETEDPFAPLDPGGSNAFRPTDHPCPQADVPA